MEPDDRDPPVYSNLYLKNKCHSVVFTSNSYDWNIEVCSVNNYDKAPALKTCLEGCAREPPAAEDCRSSDWIIEVGPINFFF